MRFVKAGSGMRAGRVTEFEGMFIEPGRGIRGGVGPYEFFTPGGAHVYLHDTDFLELAWLPDVRGEIGQGYPAIPRLWRNTWEQFIPFLAYDLEIRKVLCSTNAIESLNARYRRAVNAEGNFPTEQAALKTLYLVTRSLDPKGLGKARWVTRWKPALNAFAITVADWMPAAEDL